MGSVGTETVYLLSDRGLVVFTCVDNCFGVVYDYGQKTWACDTHGEQGEAQPKPRLCFNCGEPYTRYAWFDPTYCRKCNWSFID